LVAPCIGGDVAANRACAAGSKIDAAQETSLVSRLLDHSEWCPGQGRQRGARRIDLLNAAHAFEREGDLSSLRMGSAGKPGQAALSNYRLLVVVADPQGRSNIARAPGEDQGLRRRGGKQARIGMIAQGNISPNPDVVS
jgi:hypothetical protein